MPNLKNLTIAIITYRRPKELQRCLKSLKTQSYQPNKTIIVDSFSQKISIPESRNLALKKCQTKYLAFVDDDCILQKDWVKNAHHYISTHPKLTFVVGKTILLNDHNLIAKTQFIAYQKWFDLYHSLDTKNVIINLQKIKKLHFDTSFKIFEDVDFDQQLKSHKFIGAYNPKMIVKHPEVSNLIKAIKKNYYRGQFKAKITNKWGNFDNYVPTIPQSKNPIDFILKLAFNFGYLRSPLRPITIINNQDLGANGQRLQAFYDFLKSHYLNVETMNSEYEFKKVISSKKYLLKYGFPLLKYKILKIIHDRFKINQDSSLLFQTLILRKIIINRLLLKNKTSLAIVQYPEDMMLVTNKNRPYLTLYDSPTIYFKELELSKNFSPKTINTLKKIESKVYRLSDYVSFHWYTFFDLAKKYGLKINHPLILNWGCQTQPEKLPTNFSKVKIIHLGKLNSYWVNPNLLHDISSQNPHLHIYSYETPNKTLYPHLHGFKGYLPTQKHLKNYHFGLITISNDHLRSHGFSAKHLQYFSLGLPVLCPEWRQDKLLKSATIYYNQKNFKSQLKKYSDKKFWLKKHQAALKISQNLKWEKTLLSLLDIIQVRKTK